MRQVAGKLRLDLAQYRELAAFAQFASDLDKATRDQLTRGEKLTYVLRQPQFAPVSVERQVAILWVATNGYLDDVDSAKVGEFESGFYRFLDSAHEGLLPKIAKEKALSDELSAELKKAVTEFRRQEGFGKSDDTAREEKAEAKAEARAEAAAEAADAPTEDGAAKDDAAKPKSDAKPKADAGEQPTDAEVTAEADEDEKIVEEAAGDVATTGDAPEAKG
jgi:F-type H+-transporting ATPase subunit alpha